MDLQKISTQIAKLDKETKEAILILIELKVQDGSSKLLEKIQALEDKQEVRFQALYWFIGVITLLINVYKFIK